MMMIQHFWRSCCICHQRAAPTSSICQLLLICLLLPTLGATETPDALDLFTQAVALNRIYEPELDVDEARTAFIALVDSIRPRLAGAATPRQKIAVLNAAILTDRDVTYISNLDWRDATLAGALLRRQGNCSATSILYVLVGRTLNMPISLVHQPHHAHARWDDGETRINIETTAEGVEFSDAYYLRRSHHVPLADMPGLGMGVSMDDAQMLAVLHFYAGDFLWRAGRGEEAGEHTT